MAASGHATPPFDLTNAPASYSLLMITNDETFLARESIPLLEQLCPEFTVEDAIESTGVFGGGTVGGKAKGWRLQPGSCASVV